MTYFIPRARTGICVSHTQRKENLERGFGGKEMEWNGKIDILAGNEEIPSIRRSLHETDN